MKSVRLSGLLAALLVLLTGALQAAKYLDMTYYERAMQRLTK